MKGTKIMDKLKIAFLQLLPEKYSLLTSEDVKYPFVRSDKKR